MLCVAIKVLGGESGRGDGDGGVAVGLCVGESRGGWLLLLALPVFTNLFLL